MIHWNFEKATNAEEWNDFVKRQQYSNFLGSWEWLSFWENMGARVDRYKIVDKQNNLVGLLGWREVRALRGRYNFFDLGPFIDWSNSDLVKQTLRFIYKKTKEQKLWFYRIGPNVEDSVSLKKFLRKQRLIKSNSITNNGRTTLIIDLTLSTEDLLAQMRKNTRYYIRQAKNKYGIKVKMVSDMSKWKDFEYIFKDTLVRQDWTASSLIYMKKQFEFFSKNGFSRMFYAEYKNEIIAIAIFTAFGDEVIYHHSGSLTKFRNIPSMYLLLWEAILWYKSKGFNRFNMFGVTWSENKEDSLYGVSLFKKGFGGRKLILTPFYERIVNPLGYLTWGWDWTEKNNIQNWLRDVKRVIFKRTK